MNTTFDSSRDLRRTRLILLSTFFIVGLTGCSLVLLWLIRYTRQNMRSSRICSLILNLIVANVSVYIFATGIQIYWEFQTDRQWPFNDLLCRVVKFFQSFSILSSTYIIVAMAIDRCIAILTPLKAGKIGVRYLCGSAWLLAGLLSTPNIFIFRLRIDESGRRCTAVFSLLSSLTGRRIYLTFISLVVFFIPFLVLVLCYTFIFIKLLCREHDHGMGLKDQLSSSSSPSFSSCCSCLFKKKLMTFPTLMNHKGEKIVSSNRSSFTELDIQRTQATTFAKARSKTFRMIIVLVFFTVICGAPYYCLELYTAYTGRKTSNFILAIAGGAAVAPSSIDPWIFLLFWVNWKEPTNVGGSRRLVSLNLQQQNSVLSRRSKRSHTLGSSGVGEPCQHHTLVAKPSRLSPNIAKSQFSFNKQQTI